jgi:cytochrome oxidase Cu insertion factor (SCO1/SenC/PrrC family)
MRRLPWVVTAVVATLVAAACTTDRVESESDSAGSPAVGDRAPTFTLPAADGSRVSLSNFSGRPVLLYFSMGPG